MRYIFLEAVLRFKTIGSFVLVLAGDVLVDVELYLGPFLRLADVAALQNVYLWVYFFPFLLAVLVFLGNGDKYFARGTIGEVIGLLMSLFELSLFCLDLLEGEYFRGRLASSVAAPQS